MKYLKKILLILLLIILSITALLVGKGYEMYREAIKETPLEEKVNEIKSRENYTELSELPETYLYVYLLVEDHRFYKHSGIDVIAIGRAVVNNIKTMSFAEGGSTITQQIAKNEYFTQEKKMTRKIAEVFMAFKIEKNYDKDEILELYINTIYFGNGYYNIKDAAMGYFGKLPKDMTDSECIMLAGIPNAPSVYAPTENPDLAKQRQKQLYVYLFGYFNRRRSRKNYK